MVTVSRGLPERPHLDVPKREARELLAEWRAGNTEALTRVRRRHPRLGTADDATLAAACRLSDAQLVVAREYGFASWTALKRRIESHGLASELRVAIARDDRDTVVRILSANPHLLHLPVASGNWGPPMSHAANLGRLEIVEAIAALGARDFQHAFDRAILQGQIETARWLHARGARLAPGIIMGPCETLKPEGLRFLAELNAPFTDERGDHVAPLALVLETYARNPSGKHEVLEIFAENGYALPDTPILAFHRGDTTRLKEHLRRDPALVHRRFSLREIYPPELGCAGDGLSGMHGTPLGGTTLLHLAIDFDEREIFDLLLGHGADVDARAAVDSEGFGGHTPIFHAVVNCGVATRGAAGMAQALLTRGASKTVRASIRKFLDWREQPGWHEARDVTPAEWGRTFPEKRWVNEEVVRLVE
jgi:hypothetical protein